MKSFLSPLLTLACVYALIRARDATRPMPWLIGATVAVGCLCLVRENYVLLLAVVIGVAVWRQPYSWLEKLGRAGLLAGVMLLITLPATIHNYLVSGELVWITAGGGEVLYMGWGPTATGYYQPPPFVRPDPVVEHEDFRVEASRQLGRPVGYDEASRYWLRESIGCLARDPLHATILAGRKLLIFFNDFEVPDSEYFDVARDVIPLLRFLPTFGWMVGLGLVGFFVPGRNRPAKNILLAAIAVHVLSVLLTYNFARCRLGMIPIWILFASAGGMEIVRRLCSGETKFQRFGLLGLVVALAVSLAAFLPPPGYIEAGYAPLAEEFRVALAKRSEVLRRISELQRSFERDGAITLQDRFQLAEWCFAVQCYDRAETELEGILQQDPGHVRAQMELGVLHGQRGQYELAERLFLNALKTEPANSELWANLGNARFHHALRGGFSAAERRHWLVLARDAYRTGLSHAANDPICTAGLSGIEQSLKWQVQESET